MTLAQFISLAVSASMAGLLLSAALGTSFRELAYLFRQPALLGRSVLAMNLVVPLLAIVIGRVLDLDPVMRVVLFAMALGPVPPLLPRRQLRAGGARAYAMSLVAVSAVLSIAYVPAALGLLAYAVEQPLPVTPGAIARIVAGWMLGPLLLGAAVRRLAPRLANRLARPLAIASNALLVLALLPVLAGEVPVLFALLGNFNLLAVVLFTGAALAAGHYLGGPQPQERTVLALSAGARHPAVALVIVHGYAEPQVALGAVLMVMLVGALAALPYASWRRQALVARAVARRPLVSPKANRGSRRR